MVHTCIDKWMNSTYIYTYIDRQIVNKYIQMYIDRQVVHTYVHTYCYSLAQNCNKNGKASTSGNLRKTVVYI